MPVPPLSCEFKGCDASVMLIDPAGGDEWRSPDGVMLKPEGFSTVMSAKAAVDSDPQCRNMVSCADILALAARDSVFLVINYANSLDRFRCRVDRVTVSLVPSFVVRPAERRARLRSGAGQVRRQGVEW